MEEKKVLMYIDALRLTEILIKNRLVILENGNPVIVTDKVSEENGKRLAYVVTKEQFAEQLMYDEEGVKRCLMVLERNGIPFKEIGPEITGTIDKMLMVFNKGEKECIVKK